MSTSVQKIVVIKHKRAIIPPDQGQDDREDIERDHWIKFRQGLLIQLAALEKMLGINRRCKHCGGQV